MQELRERVIIKSINFLFRDDQIYLETQSQGNSVSTFHTLMAQPQGMLVSSLPALFTA